MPPPLLGAWSVVVRAVAPFTIHGDLYYEVTVTPADDPAPTEATTLRLPRHAIDPPPAPGERLTMTFLMGQVTAAARTP